VSTASKIEWTEVTWNPVTVCDRSRLTAIACHALTTAKRLKRWGKPGTSATVVRGQAARALASRRMRALWVSSCGGGSPAKSWPAGCSSTNRAALMCAFSADAQPVPFSARNQNVAGQKCRSVTEMAAAEETPSRPDPQRTWAHVREAANVRLQLGPASHFLDPWEERLAMSS